MVEAEAVQGMPFKFNAKKVTRLDIDLVHEEKNTAPQPMASPVFQQQYQPQTQPQQAPQNYQNPQAPHNYQNPQSYQSNQQQNSYQMNDPVSRYEAPSFGPLPSLPDSLNLPRPVPPPNLASVIPTSSHSYSNAPLKSILKRKGSPSRARNPPPPPVISKNAGQQDVNPFRSSAPTSLKQSSSAFTVDLEGNLPRVIPPQGRGPPIEFSEFSYVNNQNNSRSLGGEPAPASPRVLRLLPRSPILEFSGRLRTHPDEDSNKLARRERERSLSRDRNLPKGYRNRSRSKSPARIRSSRRSRSRSVSPRRSRSRKSRSKSKSPSRRRRSRSRSPSPRNRRRSRSPSPSPRSRRRSRSRSVSPTKIRRRRSRSVSQDRDRHSDSSRVRRTHRSRLSRSKSRSKSPYFRGTRQPSVSPPSSSGPKVLAETITHGIVVKTVSSNLFPRLAPKKTEEIIRRDGKPIVKVAKGEKPAVPIKFQISGPSTTASSIVPNPVFKTVTTPATYLQNPVYNSYTSAGSAAANQKDKKKKPKEQEPAFRIIDDNEQQQSSQQSKQSTSQGSSASDDKIKQWEKERQALKSKIVENISNSANANLLKNPVKILELKQTIQNDLQELRSKGKGDAGKNLLENPVDIEKLKQTVQRDLKELKTKESEPAGTLVVNKKFDEDVEKRLKELRSKFEVQVKDAKATTSKPTATTNVAKKPVSAAPPAPRPSLMQQKVILVDNHLNEKRVTAAERRFPGTPVSETSSGHSRPQNRPFSPQRSDFPPYNEQMEHLQEEIHRQRFAEEENRLRAMGDQNGLQQLFYMEDRRRRRMDERHLAHIRMMEIKLKKEKNFGELTRLREEWGPPAQRFEQERELRQIRLDEEMRAGQLNGQAEAIRRQEMEYQRWLEEEAMARSRGMQESTRPSRGFEGTITHAYFVFLQVKSRTVHRKYRIWMAQKRRSRLSYSNA